MNKRWLRIAFVLGVAAWGFLLLRMATFSIWNSWRNEQLVAAAVNGSANRVAFWLEMGANANVSVYADYAPLTLLGEPAIFTTLPDDNRYDNRLYVPHSLLLTVITSGEEKNRAAVIDALLSHGAAANASTMGTEDLFSSYTTPLRKAFAKNDKEAVRSLIEHGAEVNIEGTNYGNALIFDAISNEDHDLLRLMLEHGAKQSPDRDGATPLQRAAEMGNTTAMQILLEHGAKINGRDRGNKTALMFAVRDGEYMLGGQDGQERTIRFLLAHGAELEARNAQGQTALMLACQYQQPRAIHLLLAKGAKPDSKDNQGERPADYLKGGKYWTPARF